MMIELNKIYNEDCLEGIKRIKDDSVDMIITSPPYNMNLRVRNGKHCSRQIVKELSTKYSNYDDNLSMDDYYEMNKRVITECLRVSKITFYNVQFLTGNKAALFKLIGHFSENIKEFIIWDKVNAQPAIGKGVLNSRFEVLLVFTSKPDAITRQFKKCNFNRGELQNLWEIKRGKRITNKLRAVFPEEFASKIVNNFTNEGDLVLDLFSGTGTTAVVCGKNNRNYIGFELNKEYCDIANKRIAGE